MFSVLHCCCAKSFTENNILYKIEIAIIFFVQKVLYLHVVELQAKYLVGNHNLVQNYCACRAYELRNSPISQSGIKC